MGLATVGALLPPLFVSKELNGAPLSEGSALADTLAGELDFERALVVTFFTIWRHPGERLW